MSDRRMEALLTASVFEVDHPRVRTGFFIAHGVAITQLEDSRVQANDPLTVRTLAGFPLKVDDCQRIRPFHWPRMRDNLYVLKIKTPREQPWVQFQVTQLIRGDPLLLAGPFGVVSGPVGLGKVPGSSDNRSPMFDLSELGLDQTLIDEAMCGAPILNCRTGHVFGVVVRPPDSSGPRDLCVYPYDDLQSAVSRYIPAQSPANSSRWFTALALRLKDDTPADDTDLLFRLYIPSHRLYATETSRLLSLFREWFSTIRGFGIRQAGYRTGAGEMVEFFATTDDHVAVPDVQAQLETFSSFLDLCRDNGEAAIATLTAAGVERATSIDLVDRFGREARRLELDMRHERQRRVLSLQQRVEGELLEQGLVQASLPYGIGAMVERLVPGPATSTPLALLAVPQAELSAPITVQVYQNFIAAAESTVINSVAGNLHLASQAQELLALIEQFGGQDAPVLQSAVYEVEDAEAPPAKRTAAKARLRRFLAQISSMAKDVSTELLSKYLESKGL
jgi:hypothetical protein